MNMRSKDMEMVNALGERSQKYFSLMNYQAVERNFGENSQFYKKVMKDGHVFNPYIHRRWLPSQFVHIWKSYKTKAARINHAKILTVEYHIRLITDEVQKQATLYKYDKEAYYERSKFYTFDLMRHVLEQHMCSIYSYLVDVSYMYFRGVYLQKYNKHNFDTDIFEAKLMEDIESTRDKISKAKDIIELDYVVRNTVIGNNNTGSNIFTLTGQGAYSRGKTPITYYGGLNMDTTHEICVAYDKAGAYYTIKYMLMFCYKKYKGCSEERGLKILREDLEDGTFYEKGDVDKILKEMIG